MSVALHHLLLAHVLGDFFLQTGTMADNKYLPGRNGALWCTVHVAVYTLVVSVMLGIQAPIAIGGVFISHWVVDRWSLAHKWMRILGRGDLMRSPDPLKATFGAIIYVVMDQTIHLVSLVVLVELN